MFLWMVLWSVFLTDIPGLTAALGLSPVGMVRGRRPVPRTDAVSESFTEPRNGRPPQPTGVHDAPNAQLSEARLAKGQSTHSEQSSNLPSTYFMGKKIPLNVLMSPAAQAFWSADAKNKKAKPTQQPEKSANLHHPAQHPQPIRDQLHGDLHRGSIIKQPVQIQQNMHYGVRGQPVRHWSNHGNLSHGPYIRQQNHGTVHYDSNIHQSNHGNLHYNTLNVKQQQTMHRVGETIMETRKGSPSANFFDVSHFKKNYYPHPATNYQQTHHQSQPFPGHDADTRFSFRRQLRKLEYIRKHKTDLTKSKSGHDKVSQIANTNPLLPSKTTGTSDTKKAIVEYFKRKKQLQELLEQKRRESLNNIQKQPRVPLARQAPRNNIPGVTRSPILTATMLGQDMKNTTDIPEEIEINGVSYDSPHDMNGKPHPLSPGFHQEAGQPQAPGPPPPLPNSRNAPNTVTKRPILTATMLGQDMKNTTDIPEEIEINGTSYDSPHDMNGKPHPLVPGSGFYAQQHAGPTHPVDPLVRFAPTTPPPYFNDLPGMTTVDFFGNSNANSSIQGPPPPHRALVQAGRPRSDTTHLPTYRTVPATYAPPPPPQRLYTVPATYAPPAPHQPRVVTLPTTYAPLVHVNQNQYLTPTKHSDYHPPANQHNYHPPANQHNYHPPANQHSYNEPAHQNRYHVPPTAAPSPAPPPPPQMLPKPKQAPKSDIESGLSIALGTKGNNTLQSKFAATINEALQGKVRNAVDKALTSQVLDTLGSLISARIESLLGGGELVKSLASSKLPPTAASVRSKQSNSASVSKHPTAMTKMQTANRTDFSQSFGLMVEDKPFSKPSPSQSSRFFNSQNRPRNKLRYSGG